MFSLLVTSRSDRLESKIAFIITLLKRGALCNLMGVCLLTSLLCLVLKVLLLRMAKKDFTVTSKGQSFTVPKGHYVAASPHVSMRLTEAFADPTKVRHVPGTRIQRIIIVRHEHREPQSLVECMAQTWCPVFFSTSCHVYLLKSSLF